MRTAIEIKQIHILLSVVACMFLSLCVHESRAQVFILTNDQQLRDLANSPEKEIDNTTGINKSKMSLKQAVEQAKSWHSDQIVIAFDKFSAEKLNDITFGPVNGDLTHYNLYANGAERIEIPVPQTVNGAKATVDGNEISVSVKRGTLAVNLKPEQYGHLVDIHFTNAR